MLRRQISAAAGAAALRELPAPPVADTLYKLVRPTGHL